MFDFGGLHITEIIRNAAANFTCRTGEPPKAVYLGEQQFKELVEYLEVNGMIDSEVNPKDLQGESRGQVFGYFVFLVNDDNHFGIG